MAPETCRAGAFLQGVGVKREESKGSDHGATGKALPAVGNSLASKHLPIW